MSWVTVIWSMVASACLTLGAIYWMVWSRNRRAWAHLLFAATAASTAAFTLCELRQMQAGTAEELLSAMRWTHGALLCLLVSTVWFVTFYLGAGRRWLAWTVSGLRAFYLLVALLVWGNVNYLEITSVQPMPFLGDSVSAFTGVRNPWMLFGYLTMLLILIFVADASITAWRQGERRKALMVGGSVEFFLLLGTVEAALIHWAHVPIPVLISPLYLGLVVVMAHELSRDVLRASQLVHELQRSEAGLRESETRMRYLSGRLLSAQEEERRRIARELHDNLAQQVTLLAIEIGQLAKAPGHLAGVAAAMRKLGARTGDISKEIHDLSHRLHSTRLATLGLRGAVQGHCRELEAEGLQVRCLTENIPDGLPYDVALCLFRIVQEGLHNVVKHSGVREAEVTLTGTKSGLLLTIADAGNGFDEAAATLRGGLGLTSMRERVHLIGGEITLRSRPGEGATIVARVPAAGAGTAAGPYLVA
jgi:signal transduction histidine kinase